MHDPLGKTEILAGRCQKQVLDQHAVMGAGGLAGGQYLANIQKQDGWKCAHLPLLPVI